MRVVSVPVEYTSPLVNLYLNNYEQVAHLFEYDPQASQAFSRRHQVIMRDYRTDRKELARILTEYNERLNCGDLTRENLRRLANPQAVVAITGQQAGVLTGPLYTIYKTITVIQLAREASRQLGVDVIPVFWVAAEDHDFAEIDHLDFIDREQKPIRLKLDYTPPGKLSVGHIPVSDAVFNLIDLLETETNPSEWKEEVLGQVRELARQAANLADWFAAVMSWLFRDQGLVLINPMNDGLRRLWSETFGDFLDKADLVNEKLASGMAKVRGLGLNPQVEPMPNSINMFLYVNGERLPLMKTSAGYSVRGRDENWTLDDLKVIAANNPERLSPNVVLRPVAQDALLPILVYAAGPGEISYYAQYKEIYPVFGQSMPVIYPRVNVTLIERGIARNIDRYGLDFAAGSAGLHQMLDEYLKEQDTIGIDRLFADYRKQLKASFTQVVDQTVTVDPELAKHGTESLNRMLHQLDHFAKKTGQYHRKACDTVIKRFQNIDSQLFPRQNWQERVLNIFPYLFKYGEGFVNELAEQPLHEGFAHKLVYLGE